MLHLMEALKGYKIVGTDGEVGKVDDFFFEQDTWAIRHMVVKTGSWLTGRKVLISPLSVERIDAEAGEVRLSLTREKIEGAPGVGADEPVSRQFERTYYDYYGYPYYWTGPYTWGNWGYMPQYATETQRRERSDRDRMESGQTGKDPDLRSFNEVNGYSVEATDGVKGDIEDIIMDDRSWQIRHIIVDTSKWLPSKDVIVPPEKISNIRWEDSTVFVDMTKDELAGLPEFKSLDDIVEARETEVVVSDE
jgi:sporulation protein YlmC with PRC-barrel domain